MQQEDEILRRATAYFACDVLPERGAQCSLELADEQIHVAVTCRVLGFSKQAFYRWKANPWRSSCSLVRRRRT